MTPWTAACQAPLSLGFSRQEYCSGLPFPSLGDLNDPGIEPGSPELQADALPTELQGKPVCVYIPHFLKPIGSSVGDIGQRGQASSYKMNKFRGSKMYSMMTRELIQGTPL